MIGTSVALEFAGVLLWELHDWNELFPSNGPHGVPIIGCPDAPELNWSP